MKLVLDLCLKIQKENRKDKIDYILSVQRGGAVMSKIISDILDIPIRSLTVKAYKGMVRNKGTVLTEPLSSDIKNKKVVILDEISETGKTLIFVKKYLRKMNPKKMVFATLFIKPHTKFIPDIYLKETSSWIIFPYELKEMFLLVNDLKLNRKTVESYKKYLYINGVNKSLLNALFKSNLNQDATTV